MLHAAPAQEVALPGLIPNRRSLAVAPEASVTDYGLRTGEQFAASAAWRKTGLASAQTNSAFIPDSLRAAWPTAMTASFGVRELDGARADFLPNNTALWASTVVEARCGADTWSGRRSTSPT